MQWLFLDFEYLNDPETQVFHPKALGVKSFINQVRNLETHIEKTITKMKEVLDNPNVAEPSKTKFKRFFNDLLEDQQLHRILKAKGGEFWPLFVQRIDWVFLQCGDHMIKNIAYMNNAVRPSSTS